MARHLMAVCVVCLLCAEHLPCKQHFDDIPSHVSTVFSLQNDYGPPPYGYIDRHHIKIPDNNAETQQSTMFHSDSHKRPGRAKIDDPLSASATQTTTTTTSEYSRQRRRRREERRTKRHANHNHHIGDDDADDNDVDDVGEHAERLEPSHEFIQKLFQKYGNADGLTMNVLGFEKMIKLLDLYRLLEVQAPGEVSVESAAKAATANNDNVSLTIYFVYTFLN